MSLTSIPVLAIALLLPTSMPATVLTVLVGALGLGSLVVGLGLVGKLYSAAFDCSVACGVVAEIVGIVTVLAVVFWALVRLSVLLNA
jgi:hypothetical protein